MKDVYDLIPKALACLGAALLAVTVVAGFSWLLSDSQVRDYRMKFNIGLWGKSSDGTYIVEAEVKNGENFIVYKTTDSEDAIRVWKDFNKELEKEKRIK